MVELMLTEVEGQSNLPKTVELMIGSKTADPIPQEAPSLTPPQSLAH